MSILFCFFFTKYWLDKNTKVASWSLQCEPGIESAWVFRLVFLHSPREQCSEMSLFYQALLSLSGFRVSRVCSDWIVIQNQGVIDTPPLKGSCANLMSCRLRKGSLAFVPGLFWYIFWSAMSMKTWCLAFNWCTANISSVCKERESARELLSLTTNR